LRIESDKKEKVDLVELPNEITYKKSEDEKKKKKEGDL
jgi:hypothetical protein